MNAFGLFRMMSQSIYGNSWLLLNPPITHITAFIVGSKNASCRSSSRLFIDEELDGSSSATCLPNDNVRPKDANRSLAIFCISSLMIPRELEGAMTRTSSPGLRWFGNIFSMVVVKGLSGFLSCGDRRLPYGSRRDQEPMK